MKILIIHPDDRSTDFLKAIYSKREDVTVITEGLTKLELEKVIKKHDQIWMLGHGSPYGLFSVGKFKTDNGYIIDHSTVKKLQDKSSNVYIWCNADKFVERHNLKGMYSGMFISEVGEANYCGLYETTQNTVDESNNSFAQWLGNVSHLPVSEAYHQTLSKYETLAENNSVAKYNSLRLYLAE